MSISKTKMNPYAHGRWYRLFLESTGTTAKITTKEIEEAMLSGTHVNLPHDLHIVDVKMNVHNTEFDSGTTALNTDITLSNNGSKYITLPAVKSWDYMDIWVFGYRNGES